MKIVVTGATGQVGSEVIKRFALTEHEVITFTRKELDCTNLKEVHAILSAIQPDLIINAAAYTDVDKAEEEPHLAYRVNEEFVEQLALYCAQRNVSLIHLSTDYVFDGTKQEAYCESDLPHPQSIYAKSKLAGEQAIIAQLNDYIILRISWVFGIYGRNFVKTILNLASSREELKIVADQWGRPTAARDVARVILEIVQKICQPSFNHWGIYHYAGEGVTNWYEFAEVFIGLAKEKKWNLPLTHLIPISSEEYVTKVKRPTNSVLNTDRIEQKLGIRCRPWRNYLLEVILDNPFFEENNPSQNVLSQ